MNQPAAQAARRGSSRRARRMTGRMREGKGWVRDAGEAGEPGDRAGVGRGANPSAGNDALTFDQPDLTGPGTLAGLFGRELHPLSFPQELENRTADRAAVKE